MNTSKILLIIATVLFVFAAFSFNPFSGVSLGWLAGAFFAGSFLA